METILPYCSLCKGIDNGAPKCRDHPRPGTRVFAKLERNAKRAKKKEAKNDE